MQSDIVRVVCLRDVRGTPVTITPDIQGCKQLFVKGLNVHVHVCIMYGMDVHIKTKCWPSKYSAQPPPPSTVDDIPL